MTPDVGSDPIRVLFANNFDMARARAGWRAGIYPAHHLYGTARLGEEFEVVDVPLGDEGCWARLTRLTRHRLGDIRQQVFAVKHRRPGAVVYGWFAHDFNALAALRAARLFSTPIVGVFHSAPSNSLSRVWLRGYDHAIALSQYTREGLLEAGMDPRRVTVLTWAPDLDFAGFGTRERLAPEAEVVATGKTGRDLRTLLDALAETGLPATIYGDREALAPVPEAVTVKPEPPRERSRTAPLTYEHTVVDLRSAALVAIPLSTRYPLNGLTELVDALGCGRPMILTRAPYFDMDIERIGCGWWVEPGDVRGWRQLLAEAMSDRDRLDAMGAAGLDWARENLNIDLFTQALRPILLAAAGR
jgi:glycosyltransferase involved in cell wall biosynthesis